MTKAKQVLKTLYIEIAWKQASYYNKDAQDLDGMLQACHIGNERGKCALAVLAFLDDSVRDNLRNRLGMPPTYYNEALKFMQDWLYASETKRRCKELYNVLKEKYDSMTNRDKMQRFSTYNGRITFETLDMMLLQIGLKAREILNQ